MDPICQRKVNLSISQFIVSWSLDSCFKIFSYFFPFPSAFPLSFSVLLAGILISVWLSWQMKQLKKMTEPFYWRGEVSSQLLLKLGVHLSHLTLFLLMDETFLLENRLTLRAISEFGVLLIYCYLCDRTILFGESKKASN
ncbi:uncharacterized protein LOC114274688 isoform X2 [Camellia sinensis]|uniref:uncharacterized protein LOC114274688 isoform X2 n=1 Tax=Camellia sinensis TaxID=4442 RepID=UPI00103675D9|nr:uncharacterized protein LOC114274688 isoform X2 [Camellia sinensis]